MTDNKNTKGGKLTANLVSNLTWFCAGHYIDLCVDICNQFGKFIPSEPDGKHIKKSQISGLLIRGYIAAETVFILQMQFTRFRVTTLGKQCIEEWKHA